MSGYPIALFLFVSVATVLSTLPNSEFTSPHTNNLVGTLEAVRYCLNELNPVPDLELAITSEVEEISELLRRAIANVHTGSYLYRIHSLTMDAKCQQVSCILKVRCVLWDKHSE